MTYHKAALEGCICIQFTLKDNIKQFHFKLNLNKTSLSFCYHIAVIKTLNARKSFNIILTDDKLYSHWDIIAQRISSQKPCIQPHFDSRYASVPISRSMRSCFQLESERWKNFSNCTSSEHRNIQPFIFIFSQSQHSRFPSLPCSTYAKLLDCLEAPPGKETSNHRSTGMPWKNARW